MTQRIFICGDTHGMPIDTEKLNAKNFPEQKQLTPEDVVIQLGDFGWVWYPVGTNKEQEYWLDWLAGKKYTLAVVLGNHENYDGINSLPIESKWGNEVRVLERDTGKIYFLKRGGVYTIHNKKILTIGGAESTDISSREQGVSWWEQEKLTEQEKEMCLKEILQNEVQYDYVLSHTCPSHLVSHFTDNKQKALCSVAKFLDEVNELIEFKEWHFGHFHKDINIFKGKYNCHYKDAPYEL